MKETKSVFVDDMLYEGVFWDCPFCDAQYHYSFTTPCDCGAELKLYAERTTEKVEIQTAEHFHTWNCPLDPETHLCPIGYDGKRK